MPRSGHVKLVERKRGPKFYAKFRTGGHQTTRLIGPAWLKRGRPPEGYFTRPMAEVELHRIWTKRRTRSRAALSRSARRAPNVALHRAGEAGSRENAHHEPGRGPRAADSLFGKDTPIAEITTDRIDAYRAHALTEGGAHGRPLKATTVSRDLTNISASVRRVLKKGWIDTNPYEDCERIKYVPSGGFNVLSVHEVEAVARAANREASAALYRAAAYTGLRLGELRALRWRDVDFVNATLHVRRDLPVGATKEKVPKGKRVRSLPLFDQAARELDGLSRRNYLTRPDDLVFPGDSGGHLDYETTKDAVYDALAAAGLGYLGVAQVVERERLLLPA